MTLTRNTHLVKHNNVLYGVANGVSYPLMALNAMPPEYAKLFEAAMVMYHFIQDAKHSVTLALEYLEDNGIDQCSPALMSVIGAAGLVEETVERGVNEVAAKFKK